MTDQAWATVAWVYFCFQQTTVCWTQGYHDPTYSHFAFTYRPVNIHVCIRDERCKKLFWAKPLGRTSPGTSFNRTSLLPKLITPITDPHLSDSEPVLAHFSSCNWEGVTHAHRYMHTQTHTRIRATLRRINTCIHNVLR